jgi:hypothetical protein
MYGWGTRDTLGHARSLMGITVLRQYQDCFYSLLTCNIVKKLSQLLSKEICGLMVLDNFQQGVQLREQRGGRSSKFLIGTNEVAHYVNPFLNFTWDNEIDRVDIQQVSNHTICFGDAVL